MNGLPFQLDVEVLTGLRWDSLNNIADGQKIPATSDVIWFRTCL